MKLPDLITRAYSGQLSFPQVKISTGEDRKYTCAPDRLNQPIRIFKGTSLVGVCEIEEGRISADPLVLDTLKNSVIRVWKRLNAIRPPEYQSSIL
jgi:hypothetical protein